MTKDKDQQKINKQKQMWIHNLTETIIISLTQDFQAHFLWTFILNLQWVKNKRQKLSTMYMYIIIVTSWTTSSTWPAASE